MDPQVDARAHRNELKRMYCGSRSQGTLGRKRCLFRRMAQDSMAVVLAQDEILGQQVGRYAFHALDCIASNCRQEERREY